MSREDVGAADDRDPLQGVPDVDDRICDWVDGCMSERDRARFEAELRVNPQLRQQLEDYEATVADLREALQQPVADLDVTGRVMARLAQEATGALKAQRGPRPIRPLVATLLSAAALLAVTVWVSAWGGDAAAEPEAVATAPDADTAAPDVQVDAERESAAESAPAGRFGGRELASRTEADAGDQPVPQAEPPAASKTPAELVGEIERSKRAAPQLRKAAGAAGAPKPRALQPNEPMPSPRVDEPQAEASEVLRAAEGAPAREQLEQAPVAGAAAAPTAPAAPKTGRPRTASPGSRAETADPEASVAAEPDADRQDAAVPGEAPPEAKAEARESKVEVLASLTLEFAARPAAKLRRREAPRASSKEAPSEAAALGAWIDAEVSLAGEGFAGRGTKVVPEAEVADRARADDAPADDEATERFFESGVRSIGGLQLQLLAPARRPSVAAAKRAAANGSGAEDKSSSDVGEAGGGAPGATAGAVVREWLVRGPRDQVRALVAALSQRARRDDAQLTQGEVRLDLAARGAQTRGAPSTEGRGASGPGAPESPASAPQEGQQTRAPVEQVVIRFARRR